MDYDDGPMFNASLKRLEQLMRNLDELEQYAANDNALGMFANLRELKKKAKGYLTQVQIKTLTNKWEAIKKYSIAIDDDQIRFDTDLLVLLHDFDEWMQYTLHKNGVLYKGSEAKKGLEQMKKKYNLPDDASN